jgi:hypothetical protein
MSRPSVPHRPRRRAPSAWALGAAALFALAACEQRASAPVATPTASDPAATPSSPSAVAPDAAAPSAAGPSAGAPDDARHHDPTATATTAPPPGDCPRWVRAARCVAGEDVVGVAAARGIRDPNLARTTAENRALARALSGDEDTSSAGPRVVLEVTTCDGATWARVAVPRTRVADADRLRRCP